MKRADMMKEFRVAIGIFLMLMACSCHFRREDIDIQPLDGCSELCVLEQSEKPVGYLYSMAFSEGTGLILSTDKEVLRFSREGQFLGNIGYRGRARGEYNMPMIVRTDGERIFVWDSMLLKFLAFDFDGKFAEEYPYESAIRDFTVSGDKLFIYTSGRRSANIIDVYSLSRKVIEKSMTPSSDLQQVYKMISVYPLDVTDGILSYMPCDELKIFRFDTVNNTPLSGHSQFRSKTFRVPNTEASVVRANRANMLAFDDKASFILKVIPGMKDRTFLVLTCEGEFRWDGQTRLSDRRYYTIYSVSEDGESRRLRSFPYDTFANMSLISVENGALYFLKRIIDTDSQEEVYKLCRYELPLG